MQNPRLASRYAKSLLDLSVERNTVEHALEDMRTLSSVCTQSREFELMLRSPVINGDKKLKVISDIIKNYNISELTKAFINLLVAKGREASLPEIATAFITQYNEMKNIRTVKLTTAAPVNDEVKKGILAKISGVTANDTIDLKTEVNDKLIGGFVIEMGDKLYDASVLKSLNDLKTKITDGSYVTKI